MYTTDRLSLQFFEEAQASELYALAQDAGFTAHQINNYKQESVGSALAWIQAARHLNQVSGMGKVAVIEKVSQELIGVGGLTPWKLGEEDLVDITYRLRTSAWGKGLGIELARGLVEIGFKKFGLNEITATITPDNESSKKIASKLGMVYGQRILLMGVATDVYRLKKS